MVTMYKASQDKPSKPFELPKNIKVVEIEGLGRCEITKGEAFYLTCERGAICFGVENGLVKIFEIGNGFSQTIDTRIAVKKILQKALKLKK